MFSYCRKVVFTIYLPPSPWRHKQVKLTGESFLGTCNSCLKCHFYAVKTRAHRRILLMLDAANGNSCC